MNGYPMQPNFSYQMLPNIHGPQQQNWVLYPANAPSQQFQQQQYFPNNGLYQQQQQLPQNFAVGLNNPNAQAAQQQQQQQYIANGYNRYQPQPPVVNQQPQVVNGLNINDMAPVVHMPINGGVVGGGMGGALPGSITNSEEYGIREVWAHNLETEFRSICQVVRQYNHIGFDTEFPGVVARPIGEFKSSADYQYQLLRCNVDLLKLIQLGFTFFDEKGNLPKTGPSTWQFNFKFSLTEDMYAEDSVDLLQNSGIQFEKHEQEGIEPMAFAELMIVSGLVLVDNVKWLSFHSGYDFGYLLNLLTSQNLPQTEGEFFELLKLYFPNVYDVKYLMKSCKNLKGGLQEVANELEVQRVGPQHQAGSDSLLTGLTFFKMKEMFFEDDIDDSKYCGHLYGLGTDFVVGTNPAQPATLTSSASCTQLNSNSANSSNAPTPAPAGNSQQSEPGVLENGGSSQTSSEVGNGTNGGGSSSDVNGGSQP